MNSFNKTEAAIFFHAGYSVADTQIHRAWRCIVNVVVCLGYSKLVKIPSAADSASWGLSLLLRL